MTGQGLVKMTKTAKRPLAAAAIVAAGLALALGGSSGASAAEKLEWISSPENNDSYKYPKVCSVSIQADPSGFSVKCPPGYGFEYFKFAYTSADRYGVRTDGIAECGVPADGKQHGFAAEIIPDDNSDWYMTRYEIIPLYNQPLPTCPTA